MSKLYSASVNFFAVAHPQNQDHQSLVLDAGNDSDVTQSVFQEVAQFRTFEGLTHAARIFQALQSGS